jgi:hypothetical protein
MVEQCEASVSQSKFDEAHFKWINTKQEDANAALPF